MELYGFQKILNQLYAYNNDDVDEEWKNWITLSDENDLLDFLEIVKQFNSLKRKLCNSMNVYTMLSLVAGWRLDKEGVDNATKWLIYEGSENIEKALNDPDQLVDWLSTVPQGGLYGPYDDLNFILKELDIGGEVEGDIYKIVLKPPVSPLFDEGVSNVKRNDVLKYAKKNMPLMYAKFANRYTD